MKTSLYTELEKEFEIALSDVNNIINYKDNEKHYTIYDNDNNLLFAKNRQGLISKYIHTDKVKITLDSSGLKIIKVYNDKNQCISATHYSYNNEVTITHYKYNKKNEMIEYTLYDELGNTFVTKFKDDVLHYQKINNKLVLFKKNYLEI